MSKKSSTFAKGTKIKTGAMFIILIIALLILIGKVIYINIANGEEYTAAVLSQTDYSTSSIPYERGEILDRNGNVLAYSEKTYSLILEPKNALLSDKTAKATREAVLKYFDVTEAEYDEHIANEDSYYEVLLEELSYEDIKEFEDYCKTDEGSYVSGVTFRTVYVRRYPNDTLACNLLGYTASGNVGQGGIEGYYNSYLNGVDGKTYKYMSGTNSVDSETVDAEDGLTVVSTIDMNIQKIIEENIAEYMADPGAKQIGILAMDPNNGEVLAMASSRSYNPNTPMDTSVLRDMTVTVTEEIELDTADEDADSLFSVEKAEPATTEETSDSTEDTTDASTEASTEDSEENKKNVKKKKVEYDFSTMTDDEFNEVVSNFTTEQLYEALNYAWQNFCISDAFEPGSTYKAFTVAGAMEDGIISDGDEFYCDGYQIIADEQINCSYTPGHGTVDVKRSLAVSCNDAMMQIADMEGAEIFDKYQTIFNIGSLTGIDLDGENMGSKYDTETLNETELATSSFGQGVTTTMIQLASGFCSVINGGNYYVPHVAKKLVDSEGNVVENIEPVLVRKTISSEVSDYLRTYLQAVVESGTGASAGIEGYTIGGKTGTAEKLPRGTGNYVLSFIGFTPVEDPEIVLYVVVDEPHLEAQNGSGAGAKLFHQVMEDLLPYLNVYATNGDDVAYSGTEEPVDSVFEGDSAADDSSAESTEAAETVTDQQTDDSAVTEEPVDTDGVTTDSVTTDGVAEPDTMTDTE